MWKWLISLGLVVCLVMAFALPMCAPAPPEVEEKLAESIRIYPAWAPDNNVAIAKFLKEKLGVTMKYTDISCGEIEAKLAAEAPNFGADIAMACGPQGYRAKKEGWAVQYDSPIWRGESEVWKDPDNYWWNQGNYQFILIGNEDRLAEKGYTLPTSWDDLLDPKWKGEIVMPSPLTSGTAYLMLFSFFTLYGFNADKGEEGGWEFYDSLDRNIHHYTKSGGAPADLVGRGEFTLGITYEAVTLGRIEEGYPLVWCVPEEGIGYEGAPAFILKGTKELYTCQKIIDLLATKEWSKLIAEEAGYVTKEYPSEFFGGLPKYIPNIDCDWAYESKSRLCDEWRDRIGRVAE